MVALDMRDTDHFERLIRRPDERGPRRGLSVIQGEGGRHDAETHVDLASLDTQGRFAAARVISHLGWAATPLRVASVAGCVTLSRASSLRESDSFVDTKRRIRISPATRAHLDLSPGDCLLVVGNRTADTVSILPAIRVVDLLRDEGVLA